MKKLFLIILSLCLMFSSTTTYVKADDKYDVVGDVFLDVNKTDWFYNSAYNVRKIGIMTGLNKDYFGPYASLSRAQFILILYRLDGMPPFRTDFNFIDINGAEWYGQAALWGAESAVMRGYGNGYFGPDDLITREQLAVVLCRYARYMGYTRGQGNELALDIFRDGSNVSSFAKNDLSWLVNRSVILGKDDGNLLDPQGIVSRAECAVILERFLHMYGKL